VNAFVDGHNKDLRDIGITFSRMNSGFWEYKFEGIDDYLLSGDIKANPEWVQKRLEVIEKGID
jgi:hypothetical protein